MRDKLIKLRKEHGYTQKLIAQMLGVSRSFYARIESGIRNPSYGLAKHIASILDADPEDIFLNIDCFRMKPFINQQAKGEDGEYVSNSKPD